MHELSLAQNLLHQLHELAAQNQAQRIVTVTVEIGPLAGIVRDSFEFGFTTLAAESPLTRGAELKIKTPAADYQCLDCGHLSRSCQVHPANCPACNGSVLIPKGANDIVLLEVEMDV